MAEWLPVAFLDPEAIERAKQRFEEWNNFLTHTVPNDVFFCIFKVVIVKCKVDIQSLAMVCKRWNTLVRHFRHELVIVYLESAFKTPALRPFVYHQTSLKDYKNFWNCRILEDGIIATNWTMRTATGHVEPFVTVHPNGKIVTGEIVTASKFWFRCSEHVINLPLEDGSFYTGEVRLTEVPVDNGNDEYEAVIRKRRKI
jgi:hypothetical protein